MFNILPLLMNLFTTAGHSSSFLSSSFIFALVGNWMAKLVDFLLSLFWTVCKFILAVMETFEYIAQQMLGIGTNVSDYIDYAATIEIVNGTYLDLLVKIFKAVVGVSIILMIVFTIFAMVKQEWDNANNGFTDKKKKSVGNDKSGFMVRLFKNIMMILLMPLTMMFLIAGLNSIMTAFNEALNVSTTSVAGQVLASSTYDANKYRSYANAGQRVPIVVSAYNSKSVDPDEVAKLTYEIRTVDVQNKLKATATNMAEQTFDSFKDSLTYKNNKFYNSSTYGDYYEQFVATPEQYQVMADFITYIEKTGEPYYIKSVDEPDIDWKYVSDAVYVKNDNALNITYTDATDFDENSNSYTMTLAPANEVTSPISDALDSIMAMLGVGEHGDTTFNVMERDDSGDFLNLVQWANEKALIHFSQTFDINVPSTWTDTDEIIIFEFYHFDSNNTFGQNSLKDFERTVNDKGEIVGGVELDVSQLTYREYYPEADAYSPEKFVYCVLINGNYYRVEKSESLTDVYGNAYYVLQSLNGNSIVDKNVHFLDPSYSVLTTTTNEATLKLSSGFNINDKATWTLGDQILVYEYYSDLTIGNDLSRYGFADFYRTSGVDVKVPVYKIKDAQAHMNTETAVVESYTYTEKPYVLLNGTYYNVIDGTFAFPEVGVNAGFGPLLVEPTLANSTYYNYHISVPTDGSVGFSDTLTSPVDLLATPQTTFTPIDSSNANFAKYENFVLQLSENFDYTDVTTWSYKDYFVFYLYSNYNVSNSIEALKFIGIKGVIGELNGGFYFETELKSNIGGTDRSLYIDADDAMMISELNISQTLNPLETLQANDVDGHHDKNLFINYDPTANDKLVLSEIRSEKLTFSENYDENLPTTWTVLDYLLTYFSSGGYIPEIDIIKAIGYECMLYDVDYDVTGTTTVKDTLYRFGRRYTSGQSAQTFYLSSYNAKNNIKSSDNTKYIIHGTINEFFNKPLFNFICEYNLIDSTNVVSTYSQLNDNIFSDFSMYVYDLKSLVDDFVTTGYTEQDIRSLPQFTYTNESYVKNDISTWTQFDWIRYMVTAGKSTTGTYTGSVVYGNDSKTYVTLPDNKMIDISSDKLLMDLANNSTLNSTKVSVPTGGTTVENYVNSVLGFMVKQESEINSLVLHSTMKYSYTSPLTPLSSTSTLAEGSEVSDLDVLIAQYDGGLTAGKKYSYDLLFDSTTGAYYIKVGSVYIIISVGAMGSHYIEFNTRNTMTLRAPENVAAPVTGTTYTSFTNTAINKTNILDAAIYAVLDDTTSQTYQVYSIGSRQYIVLENGRNIEFIEYKSSDASTVEVPSNITNQIWALNIIDYLYENFYRKLYSREISNVEIDRVAVGTTDQQSRFTTSLDIQNPNTWNPLSIILYKLGLIEGDGSSQSVVGSLYRTTDYSRYYLNLATNVDGRVDNVYINITDLAFEYNNADAYREFKSYDAAIINMHMHTFLVAAMNGEMKFASEATAVAHFKTVFTAIGSVYSASDINQEDKKLELNPVDIENQLPTSWKWIDVLYYHYYGVIREQSKYLRYVSINGSERSYYINISNTQSELRLHYYNKAGETGSTLTNTFTSQGLETVTYSDTDFSIMGMIYNKLTGQTSGSVNKYGFRTYGTNTLETFYYIRSAYDLKYYGVYKLNAGASQIDFKVLNTSGTYVQNSDTVTAKQFLYETPNGQDVYQWTVFDFIVNYAANDAKATRYQSALYAFNSNKYIVVGEYYINLTALSSYVSYDVNAGASTQLNKTVHTPIDLIGIAREDQAATARNKVVLKHNNLQTTSGEKSFVEALDSEVFSNTTAGVLPEIMGFSQGFDPSNFKTWTLADFIIYYTFSSGYYVKDDVSDKNNFIVNINETYYEDGEAKQRVVPLTYWVDNFQSFINNGGAPVYTCYLLKEDALGNAKTYKVLTFGSKPESTQSVYVDYDLFMGLYRTKMAAAITNETNAITLALSDTGVHEEYGGKFYYDVQPLEPVVDFTYQNFYFLQANFEEFEKFKLSEGIEQKLIRDIASNDAEIYGTINLKLPSNFDINAPNTWTLLDFIVLYEYSRSALSLSFGDTSANANIFYNLKYEELLAADNYVSLYTTGGNERVLALNGNYYNLSAYITEKNPGMINLLNNVVAGLEGSLSGTFASMFKNALSSAPAGSFGAELRNNITTSKTGNDILVQLKEISQDYVRAATGSEEDIEFAEYILMLSNAQIGKDLTDDVIKEYFFVYLNDYNLTLKKQSEYEVNSGCTVNNSNGVGVVASKGSVGQYDFKVLVEEIDFAISKASHSFRKLGESANTISYVLSTNENERYYKSIYYNTQAIYQLSLTDPLYANGQLSKMVRKVSWPQKLMNDMQVLYPDLNWGTLIATDGWLDTLGEFTSAYTNGLYATTGNSSNTTAAGLVLSEFFLAVANRDTAGYANYKYSSLFKEDVLKALMLSLLGEEEYRTLSLQAEVFVEFFNTSFAAVLDDIAYSNSVQIVDGEVDNFVMCVYKSYLATILLSSDFGEYLYTIATRVYAEYTIYESMALASGDYENYYCYVNDMLNVDGELVDAFKYSTFYDLVKYENKISGGTPMYTFNMYNTYKYFQEQNGETNEEAIASRYATLTSTDRGHQSLFNSLLTKLNEHYMSVYSKDGKIPEDSPIYCFMIETYWAIYYACPLDYFGVRQIPFYLDTYKAYMDGSIKRWEIIDDVSIVNSPAYFADYETYLRLAESSANDIVDELIDLTSDGIAGELITRAAIALNKEPIMFNYSYGSEFGMLKNALGSSVFNKLSKVSKYSAAGWKNLLEKSENGDEESWEYIQEAFSGMQDVIDEISAILELGADGNPSNTVTEKGSKKYIYPGIWETILEEVDDDFGSSFRDAYITSVYEDTLEKMNNLYMAMSNYIDAQKIVDMIDKASITFALGQYGQNYVTTGYDFNIENREYTFKAELSASRLAEYVYGGAYLENFGIEPVYTNTEYEGAISQTKVFDSTTNSVKTKLGMWTQLREFAGELANYTSRLYYMTNLPDVAANTTDGVKLTDYLYAEVEGSNTAGGNNIMKTTPEFLILDYLIKNRSISADTFVRLIFGDSYDQLASLGFTDPTITGKINYSNMLELAQYLNGTGPSLTDENKYAAVIDYLIYIQSSDYTSGYYRDDVGLEDDYQNKIDQDANGLVDPNERVHQAFVNVISYLLISEEQAEEDSLTKPLVLDDITFKDFKLMLMERIVDYEQNPSETGKENASRYIELFYLISSQFEFHAMDFESGGVTLSNCVGTLLKPIELDVYKAEETDTAEQKAKDGSLLYIKRSSTTHVFAKFAIDDTTKNTILRMAGVANRPIEEIVNLEYDSLYDRNGRYDEALGDIFVVCTLNLETGKFIPVLARGEDASISNFADDLDYSDYINDMKIDLVTEYYTSKSVLTDPDSGAETTVYKAYPIIAKGVVSADGYPTAIKVLDGDVSFYRTDITAATHVDEEAVNATASVSSVKTVGYTDFVQSSSHKQVSGENKKTMFMGSYDLKTFVNSDADVYYMQDETEYNLGENGDSDGINILDNFSAYFYMGGQTYIFILLGFSTMLPILLNASMAAFRRVLDLIFLTLAGPVIISMKSLSTSDEDKKSMGAKAFKQWQELVSKTLIAAAGYIVSFNVYYILSQTALKIDYVSDETMRKIHTIGGMSFIKKPLLESVLRYAYVISAGAVVKSAASLVTRLVTAEKVRNPFAPAVGSDKKNGEKEVLESVKGLVMDDIKGGLNKVDGLITGKSLIGAKNAIAGGIKKFTPGSAFAEEAGNAAHKAGTKRKAAEMSQLAQEKGVDKSKADAAAAEFQQNELAMHQQMQDDKESSAAEFMNTNMSGFTGGKGGGKGGKKGGAGGKKGGKKGGNKREGEDDLENEESETPPEEKKPEEPPKKKKDEDEGDD